MQWCRTLVLNNESYYQNIVQSSVSQSHHHSAAGCDHVLEPSANRALGPSFVKRLARCSQRKASTVVWTDRLGEHQLWQITALKSTENPDRQVHEIPTTQFGWKYRLTTLFILTFWCIHVLTHKCIIMQRYNIACLHRCKNASSWDVITILEDT